MQENSFSHLNSDQTWKVLFSHQPASSFLQISGIVSAAEDDIVVPPNDEEIFGINSEVSCGIRVPAILFALSSSLRLIKAKKYPIMLL